MTRVQLNFELTQPLNDQTMEAISKATSIYGIHRIQIAPTLDKLTVDYDASRLLREQVPAILYRSGIPVQLID